jgi:uroporphyrinogen-III synthase
MARLLVTRPAEQAEALADRLRTLGHEVLVEPMLRIRFLDSALPSLEGVQAILLTSRNGARALAGATDHRDIRIIAVGDATAEEARAAGFAQVESADGDGAALIDYVAQHLRPEDGSLLHVSGFDVAADVAAELSDKGFQADRVVLYEADVADSLSPALRQTLADRAIDAALFYSPRAARTFASLIEEAGLASQLRTVVAIALSEQVAEGIRHLGWREVRVAAAPNEPALLSLLDEPKATPQAPPAAPAPRRPSRAGTLVTAAIVGLIAGAAGAYGVMRWLPEFLPVSRSSAPASQPAAAVPDLAPLEQRLGALEQRVGAIRVPTGVEDMAARIAALEARPAATSVPSDISARLDQLAEQVKQLEARPVGSGEAAPANSDELVERIAALEQQAKALSERPAPPADLPERVAAVEQQSKAIAERLDATAPPAGEALRMALVLGVGELSEQVLSGRPYADALAQVESLLGADAALAAPLKEQAANGISTLPALRRDFDDVARSVVEVAMGEGDHWLDHVKGRLAALFVLRRTGEVPGDAPDAIVARAEARLEAGDLAAAVAEVGKLTGRAAEAAAAWQQRAQARLDAEKALAALKRRTFELARAGLK